MSASARDYRPSDRLILGLDRLAQALRPAPAAATPHDPAAGVPAAPLDEAARRSAADLMRVNHAGEISAQGLYRGQALVARQAQTRAHLLEAAEEERAHLAWCERRLAELGDRPSRLAPLWYAGSFGIGVVAGLAGDRVSLGFVAETEKQVAEHLDDHLQRLPAADQRSRAVLQAMRADETRHGQAAEARGGVSLPGPVRGLMRGIAAIMKQGAARL